ncbi:Uma2 family endonuclease [Sphingomonas gei]|uniref:Uma2 family endonuclease n=1 Tax=Sphingomonas gei TaxID=1395960 RepID=A0A4S1XGW2_9SPHN|nr:Uma2 family endonuclease [Sphingomonas gei]TGX55864.1 Uma2 family endonuclease [Sphingomonas gei]
MTEVLPLNNAHLPVKLRLEDYLLLDEHGAFQDYAKTELIEGDIFFMNAQHRPHARVKSRLFLAIADCLREIGGLEAIVEGSIAVPPYSSPEPDIVVTDDPEGKGLIPLQSVRLIVEVSDATLAFDMARKRKLYADNAVPEYWVVDVNAGVIHQMWGPADDAYAECREIAFGERFTAATIPALCVDTSAL